MYEDILLVHLWCSSALDVRLSQDFVALHTANQHGMRGSLLEEVLLAASIADLDRVVWACRAVELVRRREVVVDLTVRHGCWYLSSDFDMFSRVLSIVCCVAEISKLWK